MFEFQKFPKIARLKRQLIITEKIDGTNAQIAIFELDSDEVHAAASADPYCIDIAHSGETGDSPRAIYAGSRSRWIAPEGTIENGESGWLKGTDNFGFARFVADNSVELFKLGPGRHYGEWYGKGIQRGYGLEEKRFALFNATRWGSHNPNTPTCCGVVPQLSYSGEGPITDPDEAMLYLAEHGSEMVPGYINPEGICVYHTASKTYYKQTFEQDSGKHSGR